MNIHKHMEAIFVVTLVVVGTGTYALDSVREADAEGGAGASASAAREGATAHARAVVVRAPTLPQRA